MRNFGVEVLFQSNIKTHPHCPHGPTLLFEKFTKDGKKTGKRFYACSACRDRKECQFFQWKNEKMSNCRIKYWKNVNRDTQKKLTYIQYIKRKKQFLKLADSQKKFCKTCSCFLIPSDNLDHLQHEVCNVNKEQLEKPSFLLSPLDNRKKEAQFLFSEKTVSFIIKCIKDLRFKKILCIGTPRLHECVHFKHNLGISSILLDIDYRYKQFYNSKIFCHYNMFNHHFFDGEKSQKIFCNFLTSEKDLVVIIDPPFGGLVDPIVHTLKTISSEWNSEISSNKEIPIMWFFPYFLETRLINSMPSLVMLDYKVDYENHPLFNDGHRKNKQGSPVRIFTNMKPILFKLPKEEGYNYCKICKKHVSKENKHCYKCNTCPSKDGRPYQHCDICKRCVKDTYFHCNKCNICTLTNHICESVIKQSICHRCGELGHKRKNCFSYSNVYKKNIGNKDEIQHPHLKITQNQIQELENNQKFVEDCQQMGTIHAMNHQSENSSVLKQKFTEYVEDEMPTKKQRLINEQKSLIEVCKVKRKQKSTRIKRKQFLDCIRQKEAKKQKERGGKKSKKN